MRTIQALSVCLTTQSQRTLFSVLFQIFGQAGPPQQYDRLVPMGNKRKVLFSNIQRWITSSGSEPGTSNLSVSSPTSYRLHTHLQAHQQALRSAPVRKQQEKGTFKTLKFAIGNMFILLDSGSSVAAAEHSKPAADHWSWAPVEV